MEGELEISILNKIFLQLSDGWEVVHYEEIVQEFEINIFSSNHEETLWEFNCNLPKGVWIHWTTDRCFLRERKHLEDIWGEIINRVISQW